MRNHDERAKDFLSVYRCIHCNRHFVGERVEQIITDHMREVHGKRANFGDDGYNERGIPSGNVRIMYIPIVSIGVNTTLSRFNGTIEVCSEEA